MTSSFRSGAACAALLVLSLGSSTEGWATPMPFGSRTLEMPAPLDFVPIAARAPDRLQMMQAYLPPASRLAEVYTTPADAARLDRDDSIDLGRYFEVQVSRKQDGIPAASRIITASDAEIDANLRKLMGSADRLVGDLAQRGNAELKSTTAHDPSLSLNNMRYVHIYRHEPWGVFLTMKGRIAAGSQSREMVGSMATLSINYQLIDLYAFSELRSDADVKWVEHTLGHWADAVHTANPDDPAIAARVPKIWAPQDLGRIGQIVGGMIGVGVALLWGARRKRKQ